MSLTVHTAPRINAEEAAELALRLYRRKVAASDLPSERDQNFLLRDAGGERFVLKLANREEDRAVLEFQNQAWAHLAAKGLIVPRLIPASDGREIAGAIQANSASRFAGAIQANSASRFAGAIQANSASRFADSAGHAVRLFTWIEGEVLARIRPQDEKLLASLGDLLARIDAALDDFRHPAAERYLHWNIEHADHAFQHLPLLPPRRRALVEQYFEAWKTVPWKGMRRSTIHGDPNDYNVLVRDGEAVAILDLGDSVFAATVCDLAIAVAYAMLDKPDPLAVAATIVAAYHRRNPLREVEIAAVFPLAMTRLAMSVCYAAFNAQAAPQDTYQQVSAAGAWRMLERMQPVAAPSRRNPPPDSPAEDVAERLRRACDGNGENDESRRDDLLQRRRAHLGPSLSISYTQPLHIVRGWRQFLYDPQWRAYLDCVNNVAHVGHCHPRVVSAIAEQSARLNTNTRYLHELLVEYCERLAATLPDPLRVVYLVCSGSEANELALRMARAHTGRRDVIVLDAAYHGNTSALVDLSPYKYAGPGGRGRPSWVHQAKMPDVYRGPHRGDDAGESGGGLRLDGAGGRYAEYVARELDSSVAAFFAESALGCGGQIILPPGYLAASYAAVRAAGGLCVADEVQTGFGRAGTHFWMFETQGVVPDIVTLGKPIGNGHPMGAVITTPEIAASFANGMEYFNTFGGNPVSCAAGLAVLDVIAEEGLQQNARDTGEYLLARLREVATRHRFIGDVRGQGLFVGIELVRAPETREPAPEIAAAVVERMKELGVLLSTDGPHHNVIKIKPPLCFTREDADTVAERLNEVL
jgi:4-aminobutyrate aminotransferase-like enzyme/Ser/Thr protein kinase RdoA (MazF antagonist)